MCSRKARRPMLLCDDVGACARGRGGEGDAEIVLGTVRPKGLVGELALFDNAAPRSASLIPVKPSHFIVIPAASFDCYEGTRCSSAGSWRMWSSRCARPTSSCAPFPHPRRWHAWPGASGNWPGTEVRSDGGWSAIPRTDPPGPGRDDWLFAGDASSRKLELLKRRKCVSWDGGRCGWTWQAWDGTRRPIWRHSHRTRRSGRERHVESPSCTRSSNRARDGSNRHDPRRRASRRGARGQHRASLAVPCPRPRGAAGGVVVVDLDRSASVRAGLPPAVHDWPQSAHAQLIDRLVDRGAATIAFDVQFLRHSASPAEDDVLARAISRAGNVVLAQRLEVVRSGDTEFWRTQDPIPELARAAAAIGSGVRCRIRPWSRGSGPSRTFREPAGH